MNRQQANEAIARRIWPTAEIEMLTRCDFVNVVIFDKPNETRSWRGFDVFEDIYAAHQLVRWFRVNSWPALYDALRSILIDKTGQPVGIVDFMLADPAEIAKAACVALEIELEEEGK